MSNQNEKTELEYRLEGIVPPGQRSPGFMGWIRLSGPEKQAVRAARENADRAERLEHEGCSPANLGLGRQLESARAERQVQQEIADQAARTALRELVAELRADGSAVDAPAIAEAPVATLPAAEQPKTTSRAKR